MDAASNPDLSCEVLCIDAMAWCRVVHTHGLQRPWDLLFPPNRLYAENSTFEVGSNVRHCTIVIEGIIVGVFVLAMRARDCCLIDVRCQSDAPPVWADALIDHWQNVAGGLNADMLTGPVGAFAFLTDGVAEPGTKEPESIHISSYPEILVVCLRRRGYVHAWSGSIWGRQGAVGTASAINIGPHSSVRVGSWMNVISIARDLEKVLSTAFSTLPWHRGSGAGLPSLIRAYAPIFRPSLALAARTPDDTAAGAVLMHKDVAKVPRWVYSLPRPLQALWLRIASARSQSIHASVIGIVPHLRNSAYSAELFAATQRVFDAADAVTTSWIRDDNSPSRMMAKRAGLSPLQQRLVFRLHLQTCLTSKGE
ncbi:MAG: hypothetical protein ACK45E_12330 [Ignavibacteria bacterium]